MAKDKETEPVVTTWIPAPHDHGTAAEVVFEVPVVEEPVSE
jgi:hypothetical protein